MCLAAATFAFLFPLLPLICQYAIVIGEPVALIMRVPTHSISIHFKKPFPFVICPFHSFFPGIFSVPGPYMLRCFPLKEIGWCPPIHVEISSVFILPMPRTVSINTAFALEIATFFIAESYPFITCVVDSNCVIRRLGLCSSLSILIAFFVHVLNSMPRQYAW